MPPTPSPTDTETATILNVDDSEPIRYSRSRILVNAGYRVIEAGTGEEALDLVVALKPQLLVIDVNLPGIDGLEVCRIVKSDAATKHIMVLQMSAARGTAMDRAAGLDRGADAYLVEPVEPVELTATVRALLRLAQSEERLRKFAGELEQLVAERTKELVQSQDRLRGLATELHLVEHRERKRLASDLHDYLAQLLVLAKMKLAQGKPLAEQAPGCAEFINQADKVLSDALTYTRTMVTELIPPYLHEFGLPTALRWFLYPSLVLLGLAFMGAALVGIIVILAYPQLPSLEVLTDYQPKIPLRVYTADGYLIGEFGEERRALVTIQDVPPIMKQAILATTIATRQAAAHPTARLRTPCTAAPCTRPSDATQHNQVRPPSPTPHTSLPVAAARGHCLAHH